MPRQKSKQRRVDTPSLTAHKKVSLSVRQFREFVRLQSSIYSGMTSGRQLRLTKLRKQRIKKMTFCVLCKMNYLRVIVRKTLREKKACLEEGMSFQKRINLVEDPQSNEPVCALCGGRMDTCDRMLRNYDYYLDDMRRTLEHEAKLHQLQKSTEQM